MFFSLAEIDATIDEGFQVLAEEQEAIKRTAFFARRPGELYHSVRKLGPDVLAPYRVWSVTNTRALVASSMSELDARHETWEQVSGEPQCWFPVSWDLFGIWPKAAAGGGVIRVDYYAWPRALLDDDDRSEFPEAEHEAVLTYGVYDGLAKRWDTQRMLEVWSLFIKQWGRAQGKNTRRMQAATLQARGADQPGYTSGVEI